MGRGRGRGKEGGRSGGEREAPGVIPTSSPSPLPLAHVFISQFSSLSFFKPQFSSPAQSTISLQPWSKMGTIGLPNGFSFCDLNFVLFFFQKNPTQNQHESNKYLIRKSKGSATSLKHIGRVPKDFHMGCQCQASPPPKRLKGLEM